MMDAADVYHAAKDAFIDAQSETKHSLVIPLPAFRAERTLADGDTDPALVTGIRYNSTTDEWVFVCIVSDALGNIYVTEEDELVGELPLLVPKRSAS